MTRWVGPRFLTRETQQDLDALAAFLRGHRTRLVLALMFITPVQPLPSNQLFLAAGLAGMDLRLIGPCFFIGRAVEYTVAALAASRAAADLAELFGHRFTSTPGVLVELMSLASIVILAMIPWARLLPQPVVGPGGDQDQDSKAR
jgi:hypothetical protein